MNSRGRLLLATGIGSVLMYFLDPQGGPKRRAVARERLGRTARRLQNEARGLLEGNGSTAAFTEVPDETLHEQIRSRLGRVVSHPGAIEVEVRGGEVALRGPILAGEVTSLLGELSSMRGIRSLEDALEVYDEPGTLPALRGTGDSPRIRPWKRDTWPPALRLAAGSTACALLLSSLKSRGALARAALGGTGAGLLPRSAFNLPWSRITGLGAGRTAVDVRKNIYVDAPVEEVFDFWSNFENLAKFLSNVKEVRRTENPNEYRWTISGPGSVPVHWNAVVTKFVRNEQVGWKTVSDSIVQNAGRVLFRPQNGGTRVEVHLKYNPGIGALGHAAARLFGSDPKTLMDEDLARMKNYLETGRVPDERV